VKDLPHVRACIVGHESVLVICDRTPDRDAIEQAIASTGDDARRSTRLHRIDVAFDGIDLDKLLAHAGISRDEFLARVRDVRLTVRYLGFRAGFAYCDGWPEGWRLPRRPTSRNRVPAGTFAIAGAMAGFYPVDSPGGWNLLGTTAAPLWDPAREPPNLLAPGDEIELVPGDSAGLQPAVRAGGDRPDRGGHRPPEQPPTGRRSIAEVLAPGQQTTIVGPRDWPRVYAGVTPGGPFDETAAARANRAAGNEDTAPLLECVLVAPTLRLARPAAFCDGALNVRTFRAGQETSIGRFHNGLRGYLAIEGGIDEARGRWEENVVLKKGDVLREGSRGVRTELDVARDDPTTIRIIPGPHDSPPLRGEWEVTNQLNRVGIRLRPLAPLDVRLPADLPSCGMQFGTLQWHPDGSLIAMGPDHPVTGGYLQPATVISEDLWKLARLAPGERIRLRS
jgi:KipI family sensor histidine kinase inhibitor